MQRPYDLFNRLDICTCVFLVVLCLGVSPAISDDGTLSLNAELVAEAQPDECFYHIGSIDNLYNHNNLTDAQIQECLEQGGTLKRNAGYLWGITHSGDELWFGTAANIGPVGFALMSASINGTLANSTTIPSFRISNAVYEMNKSTYKDGELGALGDYRPPRIFAYNIRTGILTEQTPDDPLLEQTYGLRSAGYLDGVAILAGPVLDNTDGTKGINLFAFDTKNKIYLGSRCLRDLEDNNGGFIAQKINNIRKWLEIDGVLYTTVGTQSGGKVLRWAGSKNNPFRFEVVGDLNDQGTELVYHENRLFILSWPPTGDDIPGFDTNNVCDIMMTKDEIPEGGLRPGTEFVSVWNVMDYEPDAMVASTYGLGAAVSFDGYLYWGTMHVPMSAARLHLNATPQEQQSFRNMVTTVTNTTRHTAVFRGKNFASGNPEIELLYGKEYLIRYQPYAIFKRNKWKSVPNNMGQKPLFGEDGLGNPKNYYTWSMTVYNNQLYLGTFEAAPRQPALTWVREADGLVNEAAGLTTRAFDFLHSEEANQEEHVAGFNLYRFEDSHSPATLVTSTGFGQTGTYGVRNLLVADDALYLGTASTANLDPTGGWALFKITSSGQID